MSWSRFALVSLGLGLAAMTLAPQNAAAIVVTDDVILGGIEPSSLALNAEQSDTEIKLFSEKLDHILAADLTLNVGSSPILAGTRVSSYMFHFDALSGNNRNAMGSAMFDNDVLGVIHTTDLLNASDSELGLATTWYTASLRGLEIGSDAFNIEGNMITVNVDFNVNHRYMDEMRVVTRSAIPEPGTALLLGLGLVGAGLIRRKRHA